MGFKEYMIEHSDTKMNLRGYAGDTRKQQANIRIKGAGWGGKNYVGGASNDLGFELLEDGSYGFHVSNYDKGRYGGNWQKKLTQEYAREVVKEVANDQNFFVDSEEEVDGEIFIKVTTPW